MRKDVRKNWNGDTSVCVSSMKAGGFVSFTDVLPFLDQFLALSNA